MPVRGAPASGAVASESSRVLELLKFPLLFHDAATDDGRTPGGLQGPQNLIIQTETHRSSPFGPSPRHLTNDGVDAALKIRLREMVQPGRHTFG